MILFPAIDLKDGQCVRLKLGDMARRPSTIADPAAQAKAFEDAGFRMAACRRPQRRLRGPFGQRRGGRGDPEGDEEPGAARRRHPHAGRYRGLARQGPGARHPRHGRGARSRSGQAGLPALSRERSPSASTPGAARSRSRAGRRRRRSASSSWRKKFEGAGVAAIIYTDIDRDGVLAGINWEATIELADAVVDPGDRVGRPRLDRRHRAHDHARCAKARRRDLRPRAL